MSPNRLELIEGDTTLCSVAVDPEHVVVVTDHADKRLKERLGLPKRARESAAERAFLNGKKHGDAKGRLKRFLDSRWLEHRSCNNVRIYGEHLWFFAGNRLVTVYEVPKRLRGGA